MFFFNQNLFFSVSFVDKNIVVVFIYGYFVNVLVDIGVSIFCVSFDFIFKFGIKFD